MPFFKKNIPVSEKIQISISFALQITIIIAIFISILQSRWLVLFVSSLALFFTLLPKIFERNFKIYLPIEFQFVIILFIYAGIFLGEVHDYYYKFWWWDIMLHTISSFVLGFIGFLFLYTLVYEEKLKANPGIIVLLSFCFALAIGALWEIFEFSMDSFFGLNMQKSMLGDDSGLTDTMLDLVVDSIGALFASVLGYFYLKRKRKNSFFDLLIKKFIQKNPRLFNKSK
jgi:uncharacterized membrane protein YjdF